MKESKRPVLPRKKAEHLVSMSAAMLVLLGGLLALSAWRGRPGSLPASSPDPGPLAGMVILVDAGHGGWDVGAEGILQEVELTERTVSELKDLLQKDGRFRVILSREAGEGMEISDRNAKFQKKKPDLMLSVHGNANDNKGANGFECYPSPPGHANHEESLAFAKLLAEEMKGAGAKLRGTDGVRFGYYDPSGEKVLVDSDDTKVYDMPTFGMLKNMECPAVLVEQCFITNAADVDAFGDEDGCKKAAKAYYDAVCRYIQILEETENT